MDRRALPCATILSTVRRPVTIGSLAWVSGGLDRFVMVPLPSDDDARTYYHSAKAEIDRRLASWIGKGANEVPFLGPYDGFVLNYSSGRVVRFDRSGKFIESLSQPFFYVKFSSTFL